MWWCVGIAILYIIAGIVVATVAKQIALYGAAAVSVGSKFHRRIAHVVYLFDSFLLLLLALPISSMQ